MKRSPISCKTSVSTRPASWEVERLRELVKSPYIILKTELTSAEVNGLHEVTRHAPTKSVISNKVRDRLITFGYIEQRMGRLMPTAKGILYFARHRREYLRISQLIRITDLNDNFASDSPVSAKPWTEKTKGKKICGEHGSLTFTNRHGELKPHPAVGIIRDCNILIARLRRELCLAEDDPGNSRPPKLRYGGQKVTSTKMPRRREISRNRKINDRNSESARYAPARDEAACMVVV
jgi:hypothetical protein